MKIIKTIKFNNIRGWKLFQFGKYSCHLWYAPANSFVDTHTHPNENIEILSLFGICNLWRKEEKDRTFLRYCTRRFEIKFFSIMNYHHHGFVVSKHGPFIFLNFSKWLKQDSKPTNSVEDLVYT